MEEIKGSQDISKKRVFRPFFDTLGSIASVSDRKLKKGLRYTNHNLSSSTCAKFHKDRIIGL